MMISLATSSSSQECFHVRRIGWSVDAKALELAIGALANERIINESTAGLELSARRLPPDERAPVSSVRERVCVAVPERPNAVTRAHVPNARDAPRRVIVGQLQRAPAWVPVVASPRMGTFTSRE